MSSYDHRTNYQVKRLHDQPVNADLATQMALQ